MKNPLLEISPLPNMAPQFEKIEAQHFLPALEEAIELTVSTFKDHLDAAATSLIQQANDAGGHDNTSVILIKCHKPFPEKTSWFQQFSHWFKR